MAELIAKHMRTIPSLIYKLFESVIAARQATYSAFESMTCDDPELQKNNASHKHFIDILVKSFEELRGNEWKIKQQPDEEEEDIDDVIFSNKFSSLNLGDSEEDGESSDDNKPDNKAQAAVHVQNRQRQKKSSSGKGKKGKKGKKAQKKKMSHAALSKRQPLDDIPLESYRIIEDTDGIINEYLMATYSLVNEWMSLRQFVQQMWSDASYTNLNSAVAGGMSNVAIKMVQKAANTIFVVMTRMKLS